jgi:hypothetical protein
MDRHYQQTANEREFVHRVRAALIGVDVLDLHRLPMDHRPTRDTLPRGNTAALPEFAQRILLGVVDLVGLAQHERHPIGARQLARRTAHDPHDALHVSMRGKLVQH